MGRLIFWVYLVALIQACLITCSDDVDSEDVVSQEENDAGLDPSDEPDFFPPMNPQLGPNEEFQKKMQERMQERLASLKAQYEALNETEKAEIQQKAEELREKVKMIPPISPPMCPPPPPCDCEEDEEEDEFPSSLPVHRPAPQPWWRRSSPYAIRPQSPPWQQQHQYPQMHPQGPHRYHGPIQAQPESSSSHRSRRDLARLKQTFSVTDPNEWWQDIDSGRGNEISDSIASWDLGAAAQHSISRQMDHYAPALHIGTINRGTIHNPAAGGPADRIFGYNPDFNRGDYHAFKFKPRGQFQQWKNKPVDFIKNWKYLPAGAEFFYNPNPSLGAALTGVSVDPSQKNVYSDKFLSENPGQSLPRGTYKLEWIQIVPSAKDKTKVSGFNMVVKNSQTGKHFRLNNADVNQFQGASPFRQQFTKHAHRWGGAGLAQGQTGSVYDHDLPGYRIDSGQRYYNNYGTPYYYNHYWRNQLPSKF